MRQPVTILVQPPAERAGLEASLAALLGELEWRAAGDELLLLDTSGTRELADWAAQRFPPPETFEHASCELRTLPLARGLSPGAALRAGVSEATHAQVFLMHPCLRVGAGFLEPLCAALADPRVFAAVPCLAGVAACEPAWVNGELALVPGDPAANELGFLPCEGALLRREDLAARGFDALFPCAEWLARDLGWRARRDGRALVRVAASTAELAPQPARVASAADERARLLFTWKHLDEEPLWREHLAALLARTLRATETDARAELVALALALEELPALARSRPAGSSRVRFGALLSRAGESHQREA